MERRKKTVDLAGIWTWVFQILYVLCASLCFSFSSPIQELGDDMEGDCSEFEAIPGHGLQCTISGVESYAKITKWRYSKIAKRECLVATDQTLVVEESGGAGVSRKYKV